MRRTDPKAIAECEPGRNYELLPRITRELRGATMSDRGSMECTKYTVGRVDIQKSSGDSLVNYGSILFVI